MTSSYLTQPLRSLGAVLREREQQPLGRRALLRRALAGAAGAAIGAVPAIGRASAAADPLPALVMRRQELVAWINRTYPDSKDAAFGELYALEERLEAAVPATIEGAAAQLQYLLDFSEEGLDFDERLWGMVSNIVAGLKRLPKGGAA